jgi:hypothetical protein
MVHDAPLLFTSQNRKRQRLVDETISGWNNLRPFTVQHQAEVTQCLHMKTAHLADIDGLSTLAGPYPLVQFPQTQPEIPIRQMLAPVVVFAAALRSGFLPDVAVGMALSAHMATAHYPVSLVVVPRYLEADPELENQLESQHKLVKGGVVLGQTITIPEDTRALLRQRLTSTDRQSVLAQIQANLGSVGPLAAALLALIGLGAAARAGRGLIHEVRDPTPKSPKPPKHSKHIEPSKRTRQLLSVWRVPMVRIFSGQSDGQKATSTGPYWRTAMDKKRIAPDEKLKVTVWLRSGTKVVGTESEWYPSDVEQGKDGADVLINALLQLDKATVTLPGDHAETGEYEFVLVPVADIELIAKVFPPSPTTRLSGIVTT